MRNLIRLPVKFIDEVAFEEITEKLHAEAEIF